jgi:predicted Ser/Thr protein kinase
MSRLTVMLENAARLGPYEILAPLGAGGMGEVYRARDTRLSREVAIKVLPAELSGGPDRLKRFEREARAASSLNHPNVVTIYEIGESGGVCFIAMELVEGRTLRSLLAEGPIATKRLLAIAAQIADALGRAHGAGIVHRDLKPENVMITESGLVKVLDFGLAKLSEPLGPTSDTKSPTASAGTAAGVLLGTVGYMSPEQARGDPADFRSDQFSFGAVLYELATGRRAFARGSGAQTLAAVIEDQPEPISALSPKTPALFRWVVERCLAKDPTERYSSTEDLAKQLADLRDHSKELAARDEFASDMAEEPETWKEQGSDESASATRSRGGAGGLVVRRRAVLAAIAVTAVAVALGIVTVASYRAGRKAERRLASGVTFRQMSFRPQTIFQAAFAPDGETIVYSAALGGNVPELFVIRPGYPEPRSLGLPPRTHLLSISSKGELAVLTNARFVRQRLFIGTLARVSLGDTAPREMMENVRQADWSPDGSELAVIRAAEGKDRLEFPIGKVLYETAGYLSDLHVSPRGDPIALFEHPKQWDDRGSVILVDRAGKRTLLAGDYEGEEGLSWSRAGDEILFTAWPAASALTLFGVDLSGNLRVALGSAGGLTMHDVSRAGRWLVTHDESRDSISVLAPGASVERDLSWLDGSGFPFLSRDGRMLLFSDWSANVGPNYDVCLRRTEGGPVVRLGAGTASGLSPDGKWALAIVFTPPQLVIYPTGPGETRRLPRGNLESYQSADWFPDGMSVLVAGNEAGKASRCYAQDVSDGPPRPVTPEATANCTVSPDGLQILYSRPGGSYFIQRPSSETAQTVPALTADDQVIRWSADGHALYVLRPANVPFRIERLDLASGRRVLLHEVAPADRTGVLSSWGAALTDDTNTYAYSYVRMTSRLFVVEGAR